MEGLSQHPQKTLPAKYFYDAKGDSLFIQIMAMPEYYLTNAEMDIFKNKSFELIVSLGMDKNKHYEIIELGAGDGTKTVELLKALVNQAYKFDYLPVDISPNVLNKLGDMMSSTIPGLNIKPKTGDYFNVLEQLKVDHIPKIVLFLGSNIGNLKDHEAQEFINHLSSSLKTGDKIVLGVDLIKSREKVLPAYNDAQGITREFNLNLLDRINRELGADFNRDQFEHAPCYKEEEGIAKSFLRSKKDQVVTVAGKSFHFDEGETIHTEISRKYNDEVLNKILSGSGLSVVGKIMDSESLFADYILECN